MVPLHEVLSDEETKEVLQKYGIVREQLPKIKNNDPAVRVLSAKPGQIVRVHRISPTAGRAIAYRLVVEAL